MKKLMLAIAMLSWTATFDSAVADQRCRQVQIQVSNESGQTIRIFRFRYLDLEDSVLRTNDITNVDVLNGETRAVVETLEYVGNEPIGVVSVQYRIGSGPRVWSDLEESGITQCFRGSTITHTVR